MKNYNFKDVSLVIGTRRIKGFAEGSEIKTARDEDSFKKTVGADGEVARSKTNNRSGTIEFELMSTSEDNAYLQNLVNIDENSGQGIVPSKIIDKSGTELEFAAQSWIRKPADRSRGPETGKRTWTIDCASLDFIGGGN